MQPARIRILDFAAVSRRCGAFATGICIEDDALSPQRSAIVVAARSAERELDHGRACDFASIEACTVRRLTIARYDHLSVLPGPPIWAGHHTNLQFPKGYGLGQYAFVGAIGLLTRGLSPASPPPPAGGARAGNLRIAIQKRCARSACVDRLPWAGRRHKSGSIRARRKKLRRGLEGPRGGLSCGRWSSS